jgi:hypothetical protein
MRPLTVAIPNGRLTGDRVTVVRARDLDLGIRDLLFLWCIRIDTPAAFGIEPDAHRSIAHSLNFIEVKIRVTAEVFFDDPVKVFFVDFDLAF